MENFGTNYVSNISKYFSIKFENGVLYINNKTNCEWISASSDNIDEFKQLLRRFENFVYPKENLKENIVIKDAYNFGNTSIQAFKDQDGDFTISFEKKELPNLEINEDASFWINQNNISSESEIIENNWCGKKKVEFNVLQEMNKYSELNESLLNKICVDIENKDNVNKKVIDNENKDNVNKKVIDNENKECIDIENKDNVNKKCIDIENKDNVNKECIVNKINILNKTDDIVKKMIVEMNNRIEYLKKNDKTIKKENSLNILENYKKNSSLYLLNKLVIKYLNLVKKNQNKFEIILNSKKNKKKYIMNLKEQEITYISEKYIKKNIGKCLNISMIRFNRMFESNDILERKFYLNSINEKKKSLENFLKTKKVKIILKKQLNN